MKRCFLLLIMAILLDCRGKGLSDTTTPTLNAPKSITQAQVDTIAAYIDPFPEQTQLAVALVQDTVVTFIGISKENDTLRTLENRHAAFEVGSITKVFTCALLCQYVNQGKVNLSDPIQKYLSFPLNPQEPRAQEITLRQLANHTSGLPRMPGNFDATVTDPENPYKNYGREALETYLKESLQLQQSPGEQYAYSNLGAGILGYILSGLASQSYPSLLQEKILTPLQMQNSSAEKESWPVEVVTGRAPSGSPTSNWDLNALQGAGAIFSTTEDLTKFIRANFQADAVFDLQKKETFRVSESMSLALGWHIRHTETGEQWHWHNGGTGGYSSCLVLNKDTRQGVVILSNVSAFHGSSQNIGQLCFSLMRSLTQ